METLALDLRVFEAIPGCNVLVQVEDSRFTVVAVSDEFLQRTGKKKENLIGANYLESFPVTTQDPVIVSKLKESCTYVYQHKVKHQFMLQLSKNAAPGFSETIWSATHTPVLNNLGEVAFIILNSVEITEQVKAKDRETAFRDIEKAFQLFMEAPVAVCIVKGPEYIVELCNESMLRFLGRTPLIIGHPLSETLTEAKQQGLIKALDHVRSTGQPYYASVFPAEILIDGAREKRWFDLVFKPYYQDNEATEVTSIFCVAHNVTEQVMARQKIEANEQELQARVQERTAELEQQKNLLDNILANSSNGISVSEVIRDANGIVIDARTILANDAAVRFTGLPRNVYLTKTATEIDPNLVGSDYYHICVKTLETGEPSIIQYYLEPTGKWLELTVSRMDEEHLIHIFTDVTPIKASQLDLERTIDELKRSNANLEEFAYAASHDLKEPIRKINYFSERIRGELKDSLSESQLSLFERMEHATERMRVLIDDLLEYSHVSRGVSEFEEIDLNVKVQNVLEDLELEIQEKGARIWVEPLPTIKGHRRQIQQLFQNLIGNALKYRKPDVPVEIRVSSKVIKGKDSGLSLPVHEVNQNFYLIEVEDNGIGFEKKDAERIFHVFTRLHGNTEYKGTGVGLSIAQKVVQNHKGYIRAKGEPGKGSLFQVYLPVSV